MKFERVFVPYGQYWSTPFCKWQGSFACLHPLRFAAEVASRSLAQRQIEPDQLDGLYLGNTIPAPNSFYGVAWLAGLMGAGHLTGPVISQACATSVRVIEGVAAHLEASSPGQELVLGLTADRTSNGPHVVYPNPLKPGATVDAEDWVWDNFNCDPLGGNSMIETAENVAREGQITTQEQHEASLLRYQQYTGALDDNAAFHRRFMVTPIEVNPTGRKVIGEVTGDEGVFPTTAEGLDRLRPLLKDGTVTFGGQTYPADGSAGILLTGRQRAQELSRDNSVEIQLLAVAEARTKQGFMPMANLPAVLRVLDFAGLKLQQLKSIKTHNPFAVNDIYLARELGLELDQFNNFGSSLVWGHPQAPTGMRLVIELIEELEMRGGGYGLFTGCAAGDTAAALIIRVG
jgi:acetyl-CoA acetyltransferase